MEELKEFDQICEPDVRRTSSVKINHLTREIRQTRLEDLYGDVENIDLDKNVPEEIRNHFQTARNLYVYSWFFYPFSVSASFYALISIEFALQNFFRDRSPIVIGPGWKPKRFPSFRSLIKKAVDQQLIVDEGFSKILAPRLFSKANTGLRINGKPEVQTYCYALVEALPKLRNDLAHGSNTLHDQGASFLLLAVEFINQLFSNTVKT